MSVEGTDQEATTTLTTGITNDAANSLKRYSLVKWLENSQFDAQNEWVGRLMSVQHSNIIDFDADELKSGMEISVFRNGEIWRAQVIIPKTAANTIDLPPSAHKKIRTKAMGPSLSLSSSNSNSGKLSESMDDDDNDDMDVEMPPTSKDFTDLNSITSSENANLTLLTSSNHLNHHGAKLNKELQFLQTAISESGIQDLYQTFQINNLQQQQQQQQQQHTQPSLLLKSNNNFITITCNGIIQHDTLNLDQHEYQNVIQVSDMNIEAIVQMQHDLIEQQKELKTIEAETMEQLRLLHNNISKLAKKFDSFEIVIGNLNDTQDIANNQKSKLKASLQQQQQIKLAELNDNPTGPSSSMSPSSLSNNTNISNNNNNNNNNTLSQTLHSLQLFLNHGIPTTTSTQLGDAFEIAHLPLSNHTSTIQLDNNTLALNQSQKTIKQLTNEQNQQQKLSKPPPASISTSVLLASPGSNHIEMSKSHDSNNAQDDATTDSKENTHNNNNNSSKVQGIQTQIALNRFLRESIKRQLGSDFLLTNLVSDIPVDLMKSIQKEAFDKYLPHDRRPIKAWGLALASLRCLKRDMVKNKNKQLAAIYSRKDLNQNNNNNNNNNSEQTTSETPLFCSSSFVSVPSSNDEQLLLNQCSAYVLNVNSSTNFLADLQQHSQSDTSTNRRNESLLTGLQSAHRVAKMVTNSKKRTNSGD
jgi:hypothetical protein